MNLFTRTFSKIFKSSNQQELDKIQNIILAINNKENEVKSLSESDIKEKTFNFKKNAQSGSLNLNEIIPESFALVREVAKRTLGERHYDVQLAGGLILHKGKIAEMKTGEGKTLVSTLPAYLNSLTGKGVHIVTVNDYLAIKTDGEIKKKGDFLTDFELHKNKSARVVPIALERYYCDDIPISDTITNHSNIFDFCLPESAS